MEGHDHYMAYGSFGQPLYWATYTYEGWRAERVQSSFAVIGTLAVAYLVWNAGNFIWHFVRPSKSQIYCHCPTGSWALVTGASDGIGFAFAEELLERGFNVLLHGRNPAKLQRVKAELSNRFPKRTLDITVADASKDDDGFQVVADKAKALHGKLTILVNNVGGVTTQRKYQSFSESSPEDIDSIINVNARFPSKLTNALLPTLKANRPSLVVNCGSSSGEIGVPYVTTYSATKAYMHRISEALKTEMLAEGVEDLDVTGCLIGNTISAGNTFSIPFFTISSRDCARGCLDRAGGSEGLAFCHWRHGLQMISSRLMSEKLMRNILAKEMTGRVKTELEELKAK